MVQFCYLRLYLIGIQTVFCLLLPRMARMDMDWKLKKLGQLFQVFMLCLQNNYYGQSPPPPPTPAKIGLISFCVILQEHFGFESINL